MAAVLTTLACWPRLDLWMESRGNVWSLFLILLWTAFFLWSFVFGWFQQYSGHVVFPKKADLRWWFAATVAGVGAGWLASRFVDPIARRVTPQDYPGTTGVWLAMTLFTLSFDQLFLCFAPVAFFERLIRRRKAAVIGTVIFVMLVGTLKVASSPIPPPTEVIWAIMTYRFLGTIVSTVLFYQGGVLMVWWWILLFQLRTLVNLM